MLLFLADREKVVCEGLGRLRLELARRFDLIPKGLFNLLWVTDFPLLECNEDEKRLDAKHHPFTAPMDEDLPLLETDPLQVRAKAYDIVLNGQEIGGGSLRIYQPELQRRMFRALEHRRRGRRGQVRLPARGVPVRRAAARRARARAGPAAGDPRRRRLDPRGDRLPQDAEGDLPADRRALDGGAQAAARAAPEDATCCRRRAGSKHLQAGAGGRGDGEDPASRTTTGTFKARPAHRAFRGRPRRHRGRQRPQGPRSSGSQDFDVLLLDLNMPRMGGMEVLGKLQRLEIPTEVIVLTGHGTVSLAVAAMKLGAYDFLTKPFKIAELLAVIEKAVEKKRLRRENALLRTRIQRQEDTPEIVSRSPAMHAILATVEKVAASDFPLLVEGESGVGKELIARALHRSSPRAEGPFIPLNCGAVPENIIESELFGYEKGAFTGAQARKLGLLEIAHRGTLFLDEVGEMPPALQVKFLRILETGAFFRVGGVKEVRVDIRCVSATNKDLKAEVAAGRFRADLYYRISTFTLLVPPLRERREDIPLLIEHFVARTALGRQVRFSEEALRALSAYSWPGNVRELQNVVYRLLLLAKGDLIRKDPPDLGAGGGPTRTAIPPAHISSNSLPYCSRNGSPGPTNRLAPTPCPVRASVELTALMPDKRAMKWPTGMRPGKTISSQTITTSGRMRRTT